MGYYARIVLDSTTKQGDRLTTMEVCFPRIILAEFNTHRMFSRNSASSRAIPVRTTIQRVEEDPFIPTYWGKNRPGMQADSLLSQQNRLRAETVWRAQLTDALHAAGELATLEAHKQLANRILEPFMWHTVIVTATEWNNFFALRANKDAQPEMQITANCMQQAYHDSVPQLVEIGQWHLPLLQPDEIPITQEDVMQACKISAARCARVSYLTHDGTRDIDKDIRLYNRLVSAGHMSPLEHVATPLAITPEVTSSQSCVHSKSNGYFCGNFRGWKQLRKYILHEDDFSQHRTAHI